MQRFEQQFHQPEVFVQMGKGIMAVPMPDNGLRFEKKPEVRAAEKEAEKAGHEKKTDIPAKKPKKVKEESR